MIEDNLVLQIQGRLSAQEFVLKSLINAVGQLAPNSGIQSALMKIVSNSVRNANVDAESQDLSAEMREYVEKYALQIIEAGFNARPAKS
ncbi:hypothetical protein [Methylobacterium oryzihabitans]|uniref:Uncharacterized protein n=1 Tax=Methylobacterium oryzihabitans TaxID=2499852 RepID=A0A3S2VPK6_9HYPH|nr:hypothetical protein [Methylobacterium oryzihabitans]RVU17719.1 hypothetical protein EOE48_12615 [Methylobacterium oryzihabitans]